MIFDQCCWHRLVLKYYLSFENYISHTLSFYTSPMSLQNTAAHGSYMVFTRVCVVMLYEQYNSNYQSLTLNHQQHAIPVLSTSLIDLNFVYNKNITSTEVAVL